MGNAHSNAKLDLSSYRGKFNSIVCSMDCDAERDKSAFSARFEGVHLGAAAVFKYHGKVLNSAIRSSQHIQSNPTDDFLLLLQLDFALEVAQLRNKCLLEPENCVLLTTQKPFQASCDAYSDRRISQLIIKIPGAQLRQQVPFLDQCCAIPIATSQGAGRIMQSMAMLILDEGRALTAMQTTRLGSMLVNAIEIAVLDAPELQSMFALPQAVASARLRNKARDFIGRNLSNPQLDTVMIADYCNVSLRHLHKSFEDTSVTVGNCIREMRLQRCREELLRPMPRRQPIFRIAMKCGYSSPESLARAYRKRFGKSPSEELYPPA